jgi:hypothetical protein
MADGKRQTSENPGKQQGIPKGHQITVINKN